MRTSTASNRILQTLRQTASNLTACRDQLAALPMHVVGRVGGCRIGIVHGDAESLAGWRFGHEALDDESNGPWLREIRRESTIDLFASSHTGRPVMRSFAFNGERLAVANNGAAGLPNFADTHFGVITRISLRPVEGRRLYGMRIASAFVDAIPVEFDQTLWLRKFESTLAARIACLYFVSFADRERAAVLDGFCSAVGMSALSC